MSIIGEKFERSISGASRKRNIEKTMNDWVSEWYVLLLKIVVAGVVMVVGLFPGNFAKIVGITLPFTLTMIVQMVAVLMFPIVTLMLFIFMVRTIGLVSAFFFPEIKAVSITSSETGVTVFLQSGKTDYFPIEIIESIIVAYNCRGVYIDSSIKNNSYTLPIEPQVIENEIDKLGLLKKVSSFESREGSIRSVYYNKK